MGRATGLARVVTHLGSLLMTIQRFDRDIDIQYPGYAQQRFVTGLKVALQPLDRGGFVHPLQRAYGRIVADDLAHAQQFGIDAVTPDRCHMRIAGVT